MITELTVGKRGAEVALVCASLGTLRFLSSTTRIHIQAVWLPEHMPMAQNYISRTTQNLQNTCGQSYAWKNAFNKKLKQYKHLFIHLSVIY